MKHLFNTLFFAFLSCFAVAQGNFRFQSLTSTDGLPTNEVRKVYQDPYGLIWIGTNSGLTSWDGYQIKTYKSNLNSASLLPSNKVRSISGDSTYLYIGTENGVAIMERSTNSFTTLPFDFLKDNIVEAIFVNSTGRVFFGTDNGLYEYKNKESKCIKMGIEGSIKTIYEDNSSQLWIGTWSNGLYRYDPLSGKIHVYPKMNKMNSAHTICQDSKGRIWVGSHGGGLHLLEDPYVTQTKIRTFTHNINDSRTISDNIIYNMCVDPSTGLMWIGTRRGLSILQDDMNFSNYYASDKINPILGNELNSIISDNNGTMWLGYMGNGVQYVRTKQTLFEFNSLLELKDYSATSWVKSIFEDNAGRLWLGLGNYGVYVRDKGSDVFSEELAVKLLGRENQKRAISRIMQSKTDGTIWFGTNSGDVFYLQPDGKYFEFSLAQGWFNIGAIFEDSKGYVWIGHSDGVSIYNKEEKRLERVSSHTKPKETYSIVEDKDGYIWVSSQNSGVTRIKPNENRSKSESMEVYSRENGKLNANDIAVLFVDSRGNVWAGSDGGGLSIYNKSSNNFIAASVENHLPGDEVFCIEEDNLGRLWLGTNAGLVCVEADTYKYLLYTAADGLIDEMFIIGSSSKAPSGRLYFGGHQGYNSFTPENITSNDNSLKLLISDIKVGNESWNNLGTNDRENLSLLAPQFTKKINLAYQYDNLSIEFAALDYNSSAYVNYAYMLEGYDKDWQYRGADRRFAYYNNLYAGEYHFVVRASSGNGMWTTLDPIVVIVEAAPWWSWWAKLLYSLLAITLLYIAYIVTAKMIRLRNQLTLKNIEKQKTEELNHAKLQFFTNITHELLTPLTIISASVDNLVETYGITPKHTASMRSNINRLLRLLQQILEFRKAETGNLHLRVSFGNISKFVKTSVESFIPLMYKKKIIFCFEQKGEDIRGYFDTDKLDKILYNLLSNAAKYNEPGTRVTVSVSSAFSGNEVEITVRDNGKGMSEEQLKGLFRPFYEGNYRQYGVVGTGIGLSLVKNLTELHNGSIEVESEVGQYTIFSLTIPIIKDAFEEHEIDQFEVITPQIMLKKEEEFFYEDEHHEDEQIDSEHKSMLIVDDNDELREALRGLFSAKFKTHLCCNGREALSVLSKTHIDIVISDVMMPEIDGIELCKTMKSDEKLCHIPLILLTVKSADEEKVEGYKSGADGYIAKPFNLGVLRAKVESLIAAKERRAADFQKNFSPQVKELSYSEMDKKFLKRAIDIIHNNLDDEGFNQQRLIEELSMSRTTVFYKLKSLTGLNPNSFIRNIRLKAACQLLEQSGGMRISDLCYAVGFSDPRYFSTCFKKEFSMSPTEYAESIKRRLDNI